MEKGKKIFSFQKRFSQYNDVTYDLPGGVEDMYSPSVPNKPRIDTVQKIVENDLPINPKKVVKDLSPLKELGEEESVENELKTFFLKNNDEDEKTLSSLKVKSDYEDEDEGISEDDDYAFRDEEDEDEDEGISEEEDDEDDDDEDYDEYEEVDLSELVNIKKITEDEAELTEEPLIDDTLNEDSLVDYIKKIESLKIQKSEGKDEIETFLEEASEISRTGFTSLKDLQLKGVDSEIKEEGILIGTSDKTKFEEGDQLAIYPYQLKEFKEVETKIGPLKSVYTKLNNILRKSRERLKESVSSSLRPLYAVVIKSEAGFLNVIIHNSKNRLEELANDISAKALQSVLKDNEGILFKLDKSLLLYSGFHRTGKAKSGRNTGDTTTNGKIGERNSYILLNNKLFQALHAMSKNISEAMRIEEARRNNLVIKIEESEENLELVKYDINLLKEALDTITKKEFPKEYSETKDKIAIKEKQKVELEDLTYKLKSELGELEKLNEEKSS